MLVVALLTCFFLAIVFSISLSSQVCLAFAVLLCLAYLAKVVAPQRMRNN